MLVSEWEPIPAAMFKTRPLFASPGSPLVKNLTIAILQLSESGELMYLQEKWWASSCMGADGAHSSEALQPHDLRGLFLLLGLGLGVGLLLALLELLSRARSQAKDGKVGKSISNCQSHTESLWFMTKYLQKQHSIILHCTCAL